VPDTESATAAAARAQRRAWLIERDYRVVEIGADDVTADLAAVLDGLASQVEADVFGNKSNR